MTRYQYDNAINKLHTVIDKTGCACIKATFASINFDRFQDQSDLRMNVDYEISGWGGDIIVFALILNREDIDTHEYAGYVISEIQYYGAKKIDII